MSKLDGLKFRFASRCVAFAGVIKSVLSTVKRVSVPSVIVASSVAYCRIVLVPIRALSISVLIQPSRLLEIVDGSDALSCWTAV